MSAPPTWRGPVPQDRPDADSRTATTAIASDRTAAVGRSAARTERWLVGLDPRLLHELAHLAEAAQHRRRWAGVADPECCAAELADLLAAGEHPAVGWWRPRLVARPEPRPLRPAPEGVATVVAELAVDVHEVDWPTVVIAVAVAEGSDRAAAEAAARAGLAAVGTVAA